MSEIVFIGVASSGKTALIYNLFSQTKPGCQTTPQTRKEIKYDYDGITIYDTPGLESYGKHDHSTATTYVIVVSSDIELQYQADMILQKLDTILAFKNDTALLVPTKCDADVPLKFNQKNLQSFIRQIQFKFNARIVLQPCSVQDPKLVETCKTTIIETHLKRIKTKVATEINRYYYEFSLFNWHRNRAYAVKQAVCTVASCSEVENVLLNQINLFKRNAGINVDRIPLPLTLLPEKYSKKLKNTSLSEGFYTRMQTLYQNIANRVEAPSILPLTKTLTRQKSRL